MKFLPCGRCAQYQCAHWLQTIPATTKAAMPGW